MAEPTTTPVRGRVGSHRSPDRPARAPHPVTCPPGSMPELRSDRPRVDVGLRLVWERRHAPPPSSSADRTCCGSAHAGSGASRDPSASAFEPAAPVGHACRTDGRRACDRQIRLSRTVQPRCRGRRFGGEHVAGIRRPATRTGAPTATTAGGQCLPGRPVLAARVGPQASGRSTDPRRRGPGWRRDG